MSTIRGHVYIFYCLMVLICQDTNIVVIYLISFIFILINARCNAGLGIGLTCLLSQGEFHKFL